MYFAKLDPNNIVKQVIVANQSFIDNQDGVWVQTDIDGVSPKNYAGIGYKWDKANNAFIAPQPYSSWSLDANFLWQPPVVHPNDGKFYQWDEPTVRWIQMGA